MKENILKDRSYSFAIDIVNLSRILVEEKKEYVLTKQILKLGTSIGALVREAEYAQSKADFVNKLSIALKEANETDYWLSILKDTNYINNELYKKLSDDVNEIIGMLVASVKTVKKRIKDEK
ncbi:four helix bundle protein [bacterium]|nr:four helix bundle protein [bacterium]